MIKAKSAKFLTSAANISQCPSALLSEVAFLGRSNVGKSSLINNLTESKLAKSSSTPGKTKLINFYEVVWEKLDSSDLESKTESISLKFNIIDLPGFGYAKVSKSEHRLWEKNLWDFITKRSNIKLFIHLIDSRHTDLAIDSNVKQSIFSFKRDDQAFLEVFTKADKLNKNELNKLNQKQLMLISNENPNLKYNQKDRLRDTIFELMLYGDKND